MVFILIVVLAGCAPSPAAGAQAPTAGVQVLQTATLTPTAGAQVLQTATQTPTVGAQVLQTATRTQPTPVLTATPDTRLPPEKWQQWPVVPEITNRALEIYKKGLTQGNLPNHFGKIGDCQCVNASFMGFYDHPGRYSFPKGYESLQETVNYFAGSFDRVSAAVKGGFNVASVLSPLQADPAVCKAGETPLQCEFRLHRPSIAIISMETWWAKKPAEEYARYMRQIIEFVLAQKTVPILATKADNLEGDHLVNAVIASLAYEYDIPLWNFWRAVQPLPYHGLNDDGFHLTNDLSTPDDPLLYRRLSDPMAAKVAWPVRNITALQALEAVWKAASGR